MYGYFDRSVATLAADDRLTLDLIRRWAFARTMAVDPLAALGARWPELADTGALGALDAAMTILDAAGRDTLEIQRPCHGQVDDNEAVLLGIVVLVRSDRIAAATAALTGLVDAPAAARIASALADHERRVGAMPLILRR